MNEHFAYRADLQVLRGISVLLVFLYHLNIPGFQNGLLGVDIFFVLSGFLMATLAGKVRPLEFYRRRLKRLLPAYLVVVFVTTLVVVFWTVPVDSNQRLDRLFYDLTGSSNFAFWAENSYFDSSAFKPLLNLWSLGVEVQFYMIAPFILPFLHKRKVLLLLFILASFLASVMLITISPKTSFFMLPTRIWEFLLGAYGAWFLVVNKESRVIQIFRFFSVLSISIVIAFYPLPKDSLDILTGHPSLASLIVVTSTTIILALGLGRLLPLDSWVSKLFIKMGDYSYSIYLTHFPIIVLVNYVPFGGTQLGYENIQSLMAIVIMTFLTSYLLYNYIEKIRYTENVFRPVLGLTVICFLLGLFGSTINDIKYSKSEILVFNAWKDRGVYRCGKLNRIKNPNAKTCLLGEELSDNRVLLLGNSHADSIKSAFQKAMEENEITTNFYVAINPLMSDSVNADIVTNEVLSKQINAVVIHYSPSFYSDSIYVRRLNSFIKLMKENDVAVFFIAPVPVYDFHVPKMMLQSMNDSSSDFPRIDASNYKTSSANFYKFISESGISQKNIWYPHKVLCADYECRYHEKGVPYYFDSGHLTLTGARELLPLFKEIGVRLDSCC